MIKDNKHKKFNIIIIIITLIITAAGIYLFVAKTQDFWPFKDSSSISEEAQESEKEQEKNEVLTDNADIEPGAHRSDDPTPDAADKNIPQQYEGQTDNSETHGNYGNEQFRVPEGEL